MPENNTLPPFPLSPEDSGILPEAETGLAGSWAFSSENSLSHGEVRFLAAASTPFPITISIDNIIYAETFVFGTIGNYTPVSDGFHNVSVFYTSGPRITLFEKMFPFKAGEQVTMVILDSESSGITVSQISDMACRNISGNCGCFRTANMAFPGSLFDILLQTGEPVFRDIAYNTVTPYKQAEEGNWTFLVSSLTCSGTYREVPMISSRTTVAPCSMITPFLSFQAAIRAGRSYTAYLIGNPWSNYSFQALVTEDGGNAVTPAASQLPSSSTP